MIGSSQEVLQRLGFSDKLKESEFIRNFNHWHQTSSERSSLSYFNPEKLKHEAEAFLRGYGVEYWSPTLRTHLLPSAPVFWSNDITHAETQRLIKIIMDYHSKMSVQKRHQRRQAQSTSSNESSDYKPEVTDNEDVNINSENDGEVAASRGDPVHSRLMQELVELPEISGPSGVKDLPSKVDSLEATTNKASKRVAEDTSYLYAASPAATGGATLSSVAVDAIDVWVMPPGSTKERYLLRDDVLKLGLRDLFDKIFSLLQRRDIARIDVRFLVDVKTWFILTSASVDDSEDFEKAKKSIKKVVGKQIKTGADEEDMEIEIKTSTS
ncbi:MAG: hypothetical protein M1833_003149 [Piccolia ochrophora]|nr:MAG: hypothetical protein M1833_003149 [Piccolia ochrophora]